MNTLQLTIATADNTTREVLIAQLAAIGFTGFEEREDELLAFTDEAAYDAEAVNTLTSSFSTPYTVQLIPEQNWNAVWESNFSPVVVESFCAVRADFHQPITNVQHEIIITPKMSFGTGHHATTYMMMNEMSKLDFSNKTVADFGTGTGVLAILAEKLGSRYVLATDNDDWSIANAKENIERNGCTKVTVEKADGFELRQKFDLILANINRNVIMANAHSIALSLEVNAKLLISGLLKEDEQDVLDVFASQGLYRISIAERNNWICLLFSMA